MGRRRQEIACHANVESKRMWVRGSRIKLSHIQEPNNLSESHKYEISLGLSTSRKMEREDLEEEAGEREGK